MAFSCCCSLLPYVIKKEFNNCFEAVELKEKQIRWHHLIFELRVAKLSEEDMKIEHLRLFFFET
ncbi:hypothetical protein BVRB_4g086980 [Beta vulgaris subsp. vulgaris]|uniref:Uncharacterized protein n=1 Tax=Beta vulgaris subsp. vulgaris TaxID=3555 RepID=A0A0J8CH76_BETVV|nr:hypothetical protein BVRB_4g086980 [Beta vulgaris subsp. vulgaris]